MSTRGLLGIVLNGKEFLAYNHSDSYPTELGKSVMDGVRNLDVEDIRAYAKTLVLVDDDKIPTVTQWARLKKLGVVDETAVRDDSSTWYTVLRNLQGVFEERVKGGNPYWHDYDGFQYGRTCQWAYVVNLDTEKLELYTGNYGTPYYPAMKPVGRYAERAKKDPSLVDSPNAVITLIAEISIAELKATPEYAIQRYCKRLYDRH